MQGNGMASAKQLTLPLVKPGDEPVAGNREDPHSVQPSPWMARVLSRDNLNRALKRHTPERPLLRLINRYLKAGVQIGHHKEPTPEGVPQGGPLSPVLANVVLDELDWELERRHLGFTLSRKGQRLKVASKALDKLKAQIRMLSRRTRGHSLAQVIADLKETLLGWKAYFDEAEVLSPLRDLDKWIRRRLRSYVWKQWGRRGYRELRKRGVSVELAWNTAKSAPGPWRLSHSPALRHALPARLFQSYGLPELAVR